MTQSPLYWSQVAIKGWYVKTTGGKIKLQLYKTKCVKEFEMTRVARLQLKLLLKYNRSYFLRISSQRPPVNMNMGGKVKELDQ